MYYRILDLQRKMPIPGPYVLIVAELPEGPYWNPMGEFNLPTYALAEARRRLQKAAGMAPYWPDWEQDCEGFWKWSVIDLRTNKEVKHGFAPDMVAAEHAAVEYLRTGRITKTAAEAALVVAHN